MQLAPELCPIGDMFPILSIAALLAVFAAAQDAEQPGETELAHIASLHRSVYEPLPSSPIDTAEAAARELGLRYIEGRGVERDLIQGCALLQLTLTDSSMRNDTAARADAEGLQKLHCGGLSTDQSVEAWQLAYCGIFGVTPQVIALAPGSQIDISRRGLVLDRAAGRSTLPLMSVWGGMVGCGHQVPLLRYTRVDPPIGLALPARHLLELAEWSSAPSATTGTMERMLAWHLFDITPKIDEVAFEFLEEGSGSGSAWPMPALPAGLAGGTMFAMQPSGAIHWEIPGEPKHGGEFK
jgi:hypothetical protein